jgi:hypothetical protein
VIEKNFLDDEVRRTIVDYLVTNERVDLIGAYLDMDFMDEICLKKMVVKLAIEKKKFYMMTHMTQKLPMITCPEVVIIKDYFTSLRMRSLRMRSSISTVLVSLLKLNVIFEDYTYVFEKSKVHDPVFLELLNSNIYKNEFTNWCESNPNNKSRCYDIIRKHIIRN